MNARTTDGTSAPASAESPAEPFAAAPDPRPLYERAAGQMAAVIGTVGEGQAAGPTPCADYDVRGLLDHIVEATNRMARAADEPGDEKGGKADDRDGKAEGEGGQGGHEGDAGSGRWAREYAEARARFTEGWADDARLEKTVTVPWGTLPGRAVLGGFVMETVTHAWDLSQALGGGHELDPELAEFALAVGKRAVGADRRGPEVPFAPVQPAPEGADAYEELACWLGRRADWATARV